MDSFYVGIQIRFRLTASYGKNRCSSSISDFPLGKRRPSRRMSARSWTALAGKGSRADRFEGATLPRWITARAMSTDGSVPAARPLPPKSPVHPMVAAGQFSGTWHVHTTSVTIQADGQGSAIWPGPLGPGQSEATAAPGHAALHLTSVSGEQATVLVSGSTEPSVLPDGPARLTITNQDLLYVVPDGPTIHSPFGHNGLCGPKAVALTVAQQVAAGINCGA